MEDWRLGRPCKIGPFGVHASLALLESMHAWHFVASMLAWPFWRPFKFGPFGVHANLALGVSMQAWPFWHPCKLGPKFGIHSGLALCRP